MKNLNFIVLILICLSFLPGCSKKETLLNSGSDTIFYTEYSNDDDFDNILYGDTFYVQSKSKYLLTPETVNVDFWTGGNQNMTKPAGVGNNYYVRITAKCGDRKIYRSMTVHREIGCLLPVVDPRVLNDSDSDTVFILRSVPEGNVLIETEKKDIQEKSVK